MTRRSKLEKMARYSENVPPRWWNESSYSDYQTDEAGWREYCDEVSRDETYCGVRTLTENDLKTLFSKEPLTPDPGNLRPALEYIFGDDDALNRVHDNPPF